MRHPTCAHGPGLCEGLGSRDLGVPELLQTTSGSPCRFSLLRRAPELPDQDPSHPRALCVCLLPDAPLGVLDLPVVPSTAGGFPPAATKGIRSLAGHSPGSQVPGQRSGPVLFLAVVVLLLGIDVMSTLNPYASPWRPEGSDAATGVSGAQRLHVLSTSTRGKA